MERAKSRAAALAIAAFFALTGLLMALKMCQDVDNDLFWQIKDGERVVREWHLPVHEDYSFTAAGRDMVATEWLAETITYLVFRAGGYTALVAANTALLLLTLAVVFLLLRRHIPPWPALSLLALLAFALLNFYAVRAQNWTFLFLALFLYWASLWEDGRKWPAWAMAALLSPWANMHGGFMLGWGMLGCICGRTAWDTKRMSALTPWGLGTLLCCLHPNGLTALLYPLWFMAAPPAGRGLVLEWRAVDFAQQSSLPYLLILLLLAWSGLRAGGARFPWSLLALALLVLSLRGRKLLPEFALAATALLALKLRPPDARTLRRAAAAAAVLGLAVAVWVVASRWSVLEWPNPAQAWENSYPQAAAGVLARQHAGKRIFNTYDWGGYLIYKLYPRDLVFIDGRLDPYWRLLPSDYTSILECLPGWQRLLDDYAVEAALVRPTERVAYGLSQDPAWALAYADDRSLLFLRKTIKVQ